MAPALVVVLALGSLGGCDLAAQLLGPHFTGINPTGDCTAAVNGSRAGYAMSSDAWVPDCQNPLKREYWRVFADDAGTAYVIPRPDGDPGLGAPCSDSTQPLALLVKRYDLCASATDEAQVDTVNHMQLADALAITHYLHQHLVFRAGADSITPYAIPSDVLDACALHPDQNSPALDALCTSTRTALDGVIYSGPGAVELTARLNELYGIAVVTPTTGG